MAGILQDFRYGFRILLKNPGLHLDCHRHSRSWNRGQQRNLQRRSCRIAERSALSGSSRDRAGVGNRKIKRRTSRSDFCNRYRGLSGRKTAVLEEISTFTGWRPIISGSANQAERVPAMLVGDGYFKVMKAEPLLGGLFQPEHQTDGKDFVVVLSHGLWKRRFQSDPNIIGKTIKLNLRPYVIIGVLKPDVHSLPGSLIERQS